MTPMEITLLILGVVIFLASFFIKDKDKPKSQSDMEFERNEIKRLIDKEFDGMTLRVNEATDGSIEYAMEKAERALEKISNEKIMAVSEYSTTILEDINKSHKEVMFLYDMLSDKQIDLKNVVREADAKTREVENSSKVNKVNSEDFVAAKFDKPVKHAGKIKGKKAIDNLKDVIENNDIDSANVMNNAKKNNNDAIIKLHEEGKSNVQIAKELNLGVGEVTLVIDLHER